MKKMEALAWLLFSAGAIISAILLPVHILFNGLAFQLGFMPEQSFSYSFMLARLANPLLRLFLLLIFASATYHSLHRIRHLLLDLGLQRYSKPIAAIIYGLSAVLIILGLYALLSIPYPS